MRKSLSIIMAVLGLAFSADLSAKKVKEIIETPASDSRIEYTGRTLVNGNEVSYDWSGVYVRVKFNGGDGLGRHAHGLGKRLLGQSPFTAEAADGGGDGGGVGGGRWRGHGGSSFGVAFFLHYSTDRGNLQGRKRRREDNRWLRRTNCCLSVCLPSAYPVL